MNIYVDNKVAVLKRDFSFEYNSENRLFLGRDGYTLNMTFPLKGCPRNVEIFGHIDRVDLAKERVNFECSIIDGKISLFGTLSVVKVSENEVECQFAEGRCSQTVTDPFEDVLINDLDLGSCEINYPKAITPADAWKSYDDGACEVALPWVNENSPTAANNWVKYESNAYTWDPETRAISWQPYLIVIAKRICDAIGYTYDFAEWEESNLRHLIICNTLPGVWGTPEYARVLPGWSVSEFFAKLELFMVCEFDFDHKGKFVKMRFSKNVLADIAPVSVDKLVDAYSAEISKEDSPNCDYIASKRLAYKDCSHALWNYYSCDWYVDTSTKIKEYESLATLIEKNKRRDVIREGQLPRIYWGDEGNTVGFNRGTSRVNTLLYAADVDTYFAFRSIGTEKIGTLHDVDYYTQIYVLQPVNVFGSGSVDDNSDTEEIEFVPPCIMETFISVEDDKGFMMFLRPSNFDETTLEVEDFNEYATSEESIDLSKIRQPLPANMIAKGEEAKKSSNHYDEIFVGFWDGTVPDPGKAPYPIIDEVIMTQDWRCIRKPGYSMRLYGRKTTPFWAQLPQIDAMQKFKFSWLSSEIPDPRAVFYIRGKKYLCEKITATFTENGMSQLLKGEFYPIVD